MKRVQVIDRISANWYKVGEFYDVEDKPTQYINQNRQGWYLLDTKHNREMFKKRHGKEPSTHIITKTCVRTTHCIVIGGNNREAASLLQDEY